MNTNPYLSLFFGTYRPHYHSDPSGMLEVDSNGIPTVVATVTTSSGSILVGPVHLDCKGKHTGCINLNNMRLQR